MFKKNLASLYCDINILPFLLAKSLSGSLYFILGAILEQYNLTQSSVFLYWALINILNGLVLLVMDFNILKIQITDRFFLALLTGLGALLFLFNSSQLYIMMLFAVLVKPITRHSINTTMVYVRHKQEKGLKIDFNSAVLNESGKLLGSLGIIFIGFLLSVNTLYVIGYILFNLLLLMGFNYYLNYNKPTIAYNNDVQQQNNKPAKLDTKSRWFLFLGCCDNALFFSMVSFLSLSILNLLHRYQMGSNVLYTFSLLMGLSLILSMGLFYYLDEKSGLKNKNPVFLLLSTSTEAVVLFIMAIAFILLKTVHWHLIDFAIIVAMALLLSLF